MAERIAIHYTVEQFEDDLKSVGLVEQGGRKDQPIPFAMLQYFRRFYPPDDYADCRMTFFAQVSKFLNGNLGTLGRPDEASGGHSVPRRALQALLDHYSAQGQGIEFRDPSPGELQTYTKELPPTGSRR